MLTLDDQSISLGDLIDLRVAKSAIFSEDRVYRYVLWRVWEPRNDPPAMCAFVGLNPSTADENTDDPTVRRCINFAKRWGYDGMFMLNAFAFRATKPADMLSHESPTGTWNDDMLSAASLMSSAVVAAWGEHCPACRQELVLKAIDRPVMCLEKNRSGKPKHPLYIKSDTPLTLYWAPPI